MAVGKVYDSGELGRIENLLNTQESLLQKIDKEKEFSDKKALQYTLVVVGILVLLVGLKFLVGKK